MQTVISLKPQKMHLRHLLFLIILAFATACQSGKKGLDALVVERLGTEATCTDSPDGKYVLCQKPKDSPAAARTASSGGQIHAVVANKSEQVIVFEKVVLGGKIEWAQGAILKIEETLGIESPKERKPFYDVEKQLWMSNLPIEK
jgi:hypothetical protein